MYDTNFIMSQMKTNIDEIDIVRGL